MMPILVKYIDDQTAPSKRKKSLIFLFALLTVVTMLLMPSVKAQQTSQVIESVQLNQAELDQILAPIALYPDSLLSQILVASTYPLEVVQAARWRQANSSLDEGQVLSAIEDKDWDPSVKALTPFEDLLVRLTKDLEWLQNVGDAFLQNEDQVLASVQDLRQIAYDNGSISDNDYYDVSSEGDNIVIESTRREIVYVPYYDTRVVYGDWRWGGYGPTYWDRPRNYVHLSGGFYWNSGYYVRPNIFYGGFHWGSRRLVVNHHYYDNYYGYSGYGTGYDRRIPVSSYSRWSHNPTHRRGVRYPEKVLKSYATRPNSSRQRGVTVTPTNRRSVGVNQVQEKLSTTQRTIQRSSAVNKSQSARSNSQRQTVRPTVTSRSGVNKSTAVNRATTQRVTPPQRSTQTATPTQRSSAVSRQRSTNQKVINTTKKSSRASSATSSSAYRPTTQSSRTTISRPTPSANTNATVNKSQGKWSRR